MFLLDLDDSGSTENKNEDYLVLGGISIFERQVHWLSSELDQLARSIHSTDPNAVEFHASEIFGGRSPPWNGMTRPRRCEVIKELLRILARSHDTTRAFACVVHKASYPNRDPMELAFEELCSRFDIQLKKMHMSGNTQRGLIILDESSYETTLQAMARDFRSLGTRWNVLVNIADIPLFVDSRASRCVQMADHVAYAVYRRYQAGDASYPDLFLHKFDQADGRLHGLVHREPTNPNCMCPACMSRR